jgi:hypothetical protein
MQVTFVFPDDPEHEVTVITVPLNVVVTAVTFVTVIIGICITSYRVRLTKKLYATNLIAMQGHKAPSIINFDSR